MSSDYTIYSMVEASDGWSIYNSLITAQFCTIWFMLG